MKIQVITDSTSDIAQEIAKELAIRIVPIYVRFGDETYRDGVDISGEKFYTMLQTSPVHPATSQPNPEDFKAVYRECGKSADGLVSIHISSKISGTYNSALIAQKTLEGQCPIEVIDSKFNSAGLGLVVMAAARIAQSGASLTEVVDESHRAISHIGMLGMFETMVYLARGGRVNKAIATASRFLNVMPLLTFRDGDIIRAGLVRSVSVGADRIINFVNKNTPISELTIVHSQVEERANQLKQRIGEFVDEQKISIAELGPGLGVHGGPGVLLAAFRRSEAKG